MAEKAAKRPVGRQRRRERKSVPRAQAHIRATFNNTLVTITDPNGVVTSLTYDARGHLKFPLRSWGDHLLLVLPD